MGLWDSIGRAFGGGARRLETRDDLADFMDSRSAFLAQKCIVEFCRVRSGVYWQKLFSEKEFQQELSRSRWRSYPVAYGMIAEMVEGVLRAHAGVRRLELPDALLGVATGTFARYPVPEGEPETFWTDAAALVADVLEKAKGEAAAPGAQDPEAAGAQGVRCAAAAQGHRHRRLRLHFQQSAHEPSAGA